MNILRSILLSCLLVFLASCETNKINLSDEKLAEVIADMHISEISLERHDEEYQDSLKEVYLLKLEEIHDLDRMKIKREVEALMNDRERQTEIYSKVIAILQDLEKEVKTVKVLQKNAQNKGNE